MIYIIYQLNAAKNYRPARNVTQCVFPYVVYIYTSYTVIIFLLIKADVHRQLSRTYTQGCNAGPVDYP